MDKKREQQTTPQSNEERSIVAFQRKEEHFSGPVPHPEIIREYESIYPGAAKQIFENWNKQVEHRQQLEGLVIRSDIRRASVGMYLGFIVVTVAIIGGIITALKGSPVFGGGISFSGLAFIVIAFITNQRSKSKQK